MSDLISRQDAIDVLDVLCQEHRYKIPGKAETYSQYNEAWQDALDRAEGAIGNLPSAEPEPHWIPCSERLPKKGSRCLVTWRTMLRTTEIDIARFGKMYLSERDCAWYIYGHGEDVDITDEVIAWMPLPEPYKYEEADDDSV